MNTELRKMIVAAEGRYLHDGEIAAVRDWAIQLEARLGAAARLQAAEDAIAEEASRRFVERFPEYAQRVKDARAKTARDMKLTLRYAAAAFVRDDESFFRRSYASWIAELLTAIVDAETLAVGQELLREAIVSALDPADARHFVRYVDVFIQELRK